MVQLLQETGWGSSKLKTELSQEPAIPPVGIYPKEVQAGSGRDSYTPIFTAASFTTAKR